MIRAATITGLLACLAAGGLAAVELNAPGARSSDRWRTAQFLRAERFHVRSVDFTGLRVLTPADLAPRVALRGARPLVDVDPDALCARVLEHGRVAECTAVRLPPGRLLVDVVEYEPVAALDTRVGVTAKGVRIPLRKGESATLPGLRGLPEWALALFEQAAELQLELGNVEARGPADLVFTPPGAEFRVRVGRDLQRGLRLWRELRAQELPERWAANEIDLRFAGSAVLRDIRAQGGSKHGSQ